MPIIVPEYVLESVFRDAFTLLRKYPEKFDDLLQMYNYEFMAQQYGQQAINKMKEYIKTKPIGVVYNWSDIPSKLPCITISSLVNDELQEDAYLSDYGRTEDVTTDPEVIVTSLTPISYNETTGWMELDLATSNINSVTIDYYYRDAVGVDFSMVSIINTTTRKALNLGRSQAVNISRAGSIVSGVSFRRDRYLEVPVQHQITVSIHTEDAFLTKNLRYIVLYILLSEKMRMTQRGLILSTFVGSEFVRDLEKLPEHIYTESIEMYGRTFFDWLETSDTVASSFGNKVRVPKDIYPRVDGDILTVTTSDDSQWDE